MWPFKKKEPLPLSHHQSEWLEVYVCHCGETRYKPRTFCKNCGCHDSFTKEVGRWEWDEDPNIWGDDWKEGWERENAKNVVWIEFKKCTPKVSHENN